MKIIRLLSVITMAAVFADAAASAPAGIIPTPPYPKESLKNKEEGDVGLEVSLSADSKIQSVKVVRPSGYPRLDRAAAQAAKNTQYHVSQPTVADITVRFRLSDVQQ